MQRNLIYILFLLPFSIAAMAKPLSRKTTLIEAIQNKDAHLVK